MPAWAFVPIRSPCSCLTLCGAPFERPPDCRSRSERTSPEGTDRKSTRLNSSHLVISYAVFCLKKKNVELLVCHFLASLPEGTCCVFYEFALLHNVYPPAALFHSDPHPSAAQPYFL